MGLDKYLPQAEGGGRGGGGQSEREMPAHMEILGGGAPILCVGGECCQAHRTSG